MDDLRFVDACTDEHFAVMSRIHALGWRDTYVGHVPQDYMDSVITDDHWTDIFRENYLTRNGVRGLLLYRGNTPVSCINYCRARTSNFNVDNSFQFPNAGYEDWGEIASFYTHPDERGRGYGGMLLEESVMRLRGLGFQNVFVFVLRENKKARRFYARHGFSWDGTSAQIPFPHDMICNDLRYVRTK